MLVLLQQLAAPKGLFMSWTKCLRFGLFHAADSLVRLLMQMTVLVAQMPGLCSIPAFICIYLVETGGATYFWLY
jgi:hypothetical protein